MIDPKEIGKAVRAARVRADLTQAALAEAAGISDETLSRVERGLHEPALSTLAALADALGVTLDYLAGRSQAGRKKRGSPLVQRLATQAEKLSVPAQRVLLQVAEILPTRGKKQGRSKKSKKRTTRTK